MNSNDFKEIQEQFGETMYAYEQYLKKGYLLDMMYNYHFNDYIVKEYRLNIENELLKNVLEMLNAKESLDSVEAYISNAKKINAENLIALDKKFREATQVVNVTDNLSEDMDESFETSFKEFVMVSHPAIKITVTKEEADMFSQLRRFYFTNNYSGFLACLELFEKSFAASSIKEDKYEEAARYYYDMMSEMKVDANKKSNLYPYDKENVFEDDITLASENAEFKGRIRVLTELNQSLQKDVLQIYGEEIKL